MFYNMHKVAAMLIMLDYVNDSKVLTSKSCNETLFSPTCVFNHEILQSEHASQHGAHIVDDTKRGKFMRAGS